MSGNLSCAGEVDNLRASNQITNPTKIIFDTFLRKQSISTNSNVRENVVFQSPILETSLWPFEHS